MSIKKESCTVLVLKKDLLFQLEFRLLKEGDNFWLVESNGKIAGDGKMMIATNDACSKSVEAKYPDILKFERCPRCGEIFVSEEESKRLKGMYGGVFDSFVWKNTKRINGKDSKGNTIFVPAPDLDIEKMCPECGFVRLISGKQNFPKAVVIGDKIFA